jgi:hypothetical protein
MRRYCTNTELAQLLGVCGDTKIFRQFGFASISPDLRKMLQFAQMAKFYQKRCSNRIN